VKQKFGSKVFFFFFFFLILSKWVKRVMSGLVDPIRPIMLNGFTGRVG